MKNEFCTYLTIYKGNKLPPFYLGSGTLYNIQNKNYFGSVSSITYKNIWKGELKNNPHLFDIKILRTFKTRSEAYLSEEKLQTLLNVVKNPLYINKGIAKEGHSRGDRSRPVVQLDLLGNYIGEYKSITACSRIPGIIDYGNIGACVKGTTKTAYNFQWLYKENYNKDKDYSMSENIFQFNLEGDLVKIWGYIGEIKGEYGGFELSNKKIVISKGFIWFKRELAINKNEILRLLKERNEKYIESKKNTRYVCKYDNVNFIIYDGIADEIKEINYNNINKKERKIFLRRFRDRQIINGKLIFLQELWSGDNKMCINEYKNIEKQHKENTRLGNIKREQTRDKICKGKLIIKLDLEGNFIEKFKNTREIFKVHGKELRDLVYGCLKGKLKSGCGFQWFYEEDYLKNPDIGRNREYGPTFNYIIAQIDKKSGIILKLWNSAISVKHYFGSGDVNAVLRKKQSTSNGFKWSELSREKLGELDCVGMNIRDLEFAVLR